MPDRILDLGPPTTGWAIYALRWFVILLMVASGITATVYAYNGANAVAALRTSSARNECRTRVQNADDDEFRHRIGAILAAAQRRDDQVVEVLAHQIEAEQATQSKIDDRCPAPLVKGSPRTTTTNTTEGNHP